MQRLRRKNTPTNGSTPAELLMESEVVNAISRERLKEAVFYWFRLGVAQMGGHAQISQEYALILTKIAYWLHDYLHNRSRRGLLLMGGVGCGKSTAMRALRSTVNRLVELRCRHDYGLTRQLMMGIVSATELSDDRQTDPQPGGTLSPGSPRQGPGRRYPPGHPAKAKAPSPGGGRQRHAPHHESDRRLNHV